MITTQPWDSPLAQALRPEDWTWYGPQSALLVEVRDHLRQINFKTPLRRASDRQRLPKMTKPPWAVDHEVTTFKPEPSTSDDVDAHIARLNGAR